MVEQGNDDGLKLLKDPESIGRASRNALRILEMFSGAPTLEMKRLMENADPAQLIAKEMSNSHPGRSSVADLRIAANLGLYVGVLAAVEYTKGQAGPVISGLIERDISILSKVEKIMEEDI